MPYKIPVMVFVVIVLVLRIAPAADTTMPAEPNSESDAAPTKIEFAIARGDYVFLGIDTGTKDKHKEDLGIIPIGKFRVAGDAASDAWRLEIHAKKAISTQNRGDAAGWLFRSVLFTKYPDGHPKRSIGYHWGDPVNPGVEAEDLPLKATGDSSGNSRNSFRLVYLPFAKANGEVHRLVIAIGPEIPAFQDAIVIPKTYFLFSWDAKDWLQCR
jgi:hypothetical protein